MAGTSLHIHSRSHDFSLELSKDQAVGFLKKDQRTALHMGLWDKIWDLFRPEKKADALKALWSFLYPEEDGHPQNEAVRFNKTIVAFGKLASLCDGGVTHGKKVTLTPDNQLQVGFSLDDRLVVTHQFTLDIMPDGTLYLGGMNFVGADLSGADLRGAKLFGGHLRRADLRGVNLRGVNLRGADLSGADLRGADLRGVNLRGADLSGADLRGADLSGADLSDTNFFRATVGDADFSMTNPTDSSLTYNSKKWPDMTVLEKLLQVVTFNKDNPRFTKMRDEIDSFMSAFSGGESPSSCESKPFATAVIGNHSISCYYADENTMRIQYGNDDSDTVHLNQSQSVNFLQALPDGTYPSPENPESTVSVFHNHNFPDPQFQNPDSLLDAVKNTPTFFRENLNKATRSDFNTLFTDAFRNLSDSDTRVVVDGETIPPDTLKAYITAAGLTDGSKTASPNPVAPPEASLEVKAVFDKLNSSQGLQAALYSSVCQMYHVDPYALECGSSLIKIGEGSKGQYDVTITSGDTSFSVQVTYTILGADHLRTAVSAAKLKAEYSVPKDTTPDQASLQKLISQKTPFILSHSLTRFH